MYERAVFPTLISINTGKRSKPGVPHERWDADNLPGSVMAGHKLSSGARRLGFVNVDDTRLCNQVGTTTTFDEH